jgi:hypothetical protein
MPPPKNPPEPQPGEAAVGQSSFDTPEEATAGYTPRPPEGSGGGGAAYSPAMSTDYATWDRSLADDNWDPDSGNINAVTDQTHVDASGSVTVDTSAGWVDEWGYPSPVINESGLYRVTISLRNGMALIASPTVSDGLTNYVALDFWVGTPADGDYVDSVALEREEYVPYGLIAGSSIATAIEVTQFLEAGWHVEPTFGPGYVGAAAAGMFVGAYLFLARVT